MQVCPDSEGEQTWEREVRALQAALEVHPQARGFLVTLDATPPTHALPDGVTWAPAAGWLLEDL